MLLWLSYHSMCVPLSASIHETEEGSVEGVAQLCGEKTTEEGSEADGGRES